MILTLVTLSASCASEPPSQPAVTVEDVESRSLYGLEVGARWLYQEGSALRWKEITGCEDVLVIDVDTGARGTVRAYVREQRDPVGITAVHYLVAGDTGVHRVRVDDFTPATSMLREVHLYTPSLLRVPAGPYPSGMEWTFMLHAADFHPDYVRKKSTDLLAGRLQAGEPAEVASYAGLFSATPFELRWNGATIGTRIHYASGIGAVRQELGKTVQEDLMSFHRGHGSCQGQALDAAAPCEAPSSVCDNAWRSGVRGCTDPRVDPANCGACGTRCESGVCAGGHCVVPGCALACDGAAVCCPKPWDAKAPGCTNPARDLHNCGGCGVVCPAGWQCQRGQCVCGPGRRDCGSGTCQDVITDAANCGACGHRCDAETPVCRAGFCVKCEAIGMVNCAGTCTRLDSDGQNCGACGRACQVGGTGLSGLCEGGFCLSCEKSHLDDCGGDCVSLQWSDKHCGACDHACDAGAVCVRGSCLTGDGSCGASCAKQNEICCGGTCVNPRTSNTYCGGCNVTPCMGGCSSTCLDGACGDDCSSGD